MRTAECNHNHNDIKIIEEIVKVMPSDEKLDKLSEFFKAFSDPGRLRIIQALAQNELCVCDIADISSKVRKQEYCARDNVRFEIWLFVAAVLVTAAAAVESQLYIRLMTATFSTSTERDLFT